MIRATAVCCLLAAASPGAPLLAQSAQSTPSPSELRVFDPSLIDTTVDPCQNFYRFSCNGWFKKNPLPADQASYGRFTELYELNRLHLRQILESAASAHPAARSANEQKIGDDYASCMNVPEIDKQGLKPLQPELDRIGALKSVDDFPALLGHLHRIGVDAFFSIDAGQDFADANRVISFYYAGGLGLPERDYYTRTDAKSVEQRRQYVEHVAKMFTLAGEPQSQAAQDAATVLAIETRLAKASLTITEQRDPQNLNHPTDIATFGKQLTQFKLAAYDAAAHAPTDGSMDDTEPNPSPNSTPSSPTRRSIKSKTYLRWHLLHAFAGTSLPQAFDQESWHFYAHILNGAEKEQERWKRCTSRVDREMGEALGQVYVAKYFPPDAKQRALAMTLAIEQAMGSDIQSLDWMSPETKAKAEEKLRAVMNKIEKTARHRHHGALDVTRAEFGGTHRQNLIVAQTIQLQDELVLKNYISS